MTSPDRHPVSFTVRASAEPQTLSRVLEVFALRDIVPSRFAGRLHGDDGGLRIEVDVCGLSAAEAGKLAQRLRAMVCVERVLLRTPATRVAPARRAAAGSLS